MRGSSVDALLLTIVKVVTTLIGLICIKIISVYFSLDSYGLYSQAILIVSTVTSLIILGMTDAVNFFYNNKSQNNDYSRKQYLSTIFTIEGAAGIIGGIAILAFSPLLTTYFKNPSLWGVYGWIAFQPLFKCIFNMLQVLYISVGRTKSILILNLVMAVARLCIIISAALITKSIITILAFTFICDIAQVAYLIIDLRRNNVKISILDFKKELCSPVLRFAVPMAAYVLINTLLRDSDKWVVGYFGTTNDLAVYTNCSRVLPFDMLIMSFYTILVPIITRYISNDREQAAQLFGHYLNLGILTTSILVIPAIIFSRDLLLLLYSPQYLSGLYIFIIYLFVDFCRFANISLIFSASGHTKKLLYIVIATFFANLISAIVLYKFLGLAGPALSTLICLIGSTIIYMAGSSKILKQSVFRLLNLRKAIFIIVQTFALGIIIKFATDHYISSWDPIPRFMLCYSATAIIVTAFNYQPILHLAKSINQAGK